MNLMGFYSVGWGAAPFTVLPMWRTQIRVSLGVYGLPISVSSWLLSAQPCRFRRVIERFDHTTHLKITSEIHGGNGHRLKAMSRNYSNPLALSVCDLR